MRLTLRTLLAYRDHVLSPEDQTDLHRRIQENPHIANLLLRIDELASARQIYSPKPDEIGVADPNVAAEYLDDVLTSELVSELERLCLIKGEYLSELADCHRLLAGAMQKKVAVPAALESLALSLSALDAKKRLNESLAGKSPMKIHSDIEGLDFAGQLPAGKVAYDRSDPVSAEMNVNVQAPMVASGGDTIRHEGLNLEDQRLAVEVPEYLISSASNQWQLPAMMVGLLAMMALLLWHTVGSFDSIRQLWHSPGSWQTMATSEEPVASDKSEQRAVPSSGDTASTHSRAGSVVNAEVPDNTVQPSQVAASTPRNSETQPDVSSSNDLAEIASEGNQDSSNTDRGRQTDLSERATNEAVSPDGSSSPVNQSSEVAETPVSDNQGSISKPESVGIQWLPRDPLESQAAIIIQSPSTTLRILNEGTTVTDGSRLVSPSSVQTSFELQPWSLTLSGPSEFQVKSDQARIVFITTLFRGMFSCSQVNVPLDFRTPSGEFSVTVLKPNVWLAIEFNFRPSQRGSITEPDSVVPVFVVVVGTDGDSAEGPVAVVRTGESDESYVIERAGLGVASVNRQPLAEFVLNNPPAWYGKRVIRHIDQEASADFSALLRRNEDISAQQVASLSSDRRPEVAALAIQTSMMLGDWRPMASELLRSDRLRSHWSGTLDLARQILAADASASQNLRRELIEFYADEGHDLAGMILGISREQQTNQTLALLIKNLESESLPKRVTAAYELLQLTGQDYGYLPHSPDRSRIQQFRKQLTGGRLTIQPVKDPLWERSVSP